MKKMIKHAMIIIAMLTPIDSIAGVHSHSNTHSETLKHKSDKKKSQKKGKVYIDKRTIKSKKRLAIKNEETGKASWYGKQFLGRKTASGERFVKDKLTAAHKTLPLGSIVKITNTTTNEEVIVRINDRGPFTKGRIIDLSPAAAKQVSVMSKGVAHIKLQVLSIPDNNT